MDKLFSAMDWQRAGAYIFHDFLQALYTLLSAKYVKSKHSADDWIADMHIKRALLPRRCIACAKIPMLQLLLHVLLFTVA